MGFRLASGDRGRAGAPKELMTCLQYGLAIKIVSGYALERQGRLVADLLQRKAGADFFDFLHGR